MNLWRRFISLLLAVAALGAVVRSADASLVGRVGGVLAALALAVVAVGVWRAHAWAHGSAFFLALCWLWAVVALRIQGVVASPEILLWMAWSVTVMVGSVRARPA